VEVFCLLTQLRLKLTAFFLRGNVKYSLYSSPSHPRVIITLAQPSLLLFHREIAAVSSSSSMEAF
jgi:hypothetical protein